MLPGNPGNNPGGSNPGGCPPGNNPGGSTPGNPGNNPGGSTPGNPGNPGNTPGGGNPGGANPAQGKSFGATCQTGSECASGMCVKGPAGAPFCSKKCGNAGECAGAGCHQTNVPGLKVCGDPGQSQPGGGGNLNPPPAKDTVKPIVQITSPGSGATVSTATTVVAKISDSSGLKYATVRVDGAPRGTVTAAPYSFKLKLAVGAHTIVVEAKDKAGNLGKASLKVTAKAAPAPSPAPGPGTGTSGGSPPAAKFGYGASCSEWSDCQSGMCAHDASLQQSYCTRTCDILAAAPCPTGSTCRASNSGGAICAPALPGPSADLDQLSAGCTMGATGPAGPLALLPLLLLLALLRRETIPHS